MAAADVINIQQNIQQSTTPDAQAQALVKTSKTFFTNIEYPECLLEQQKNKLCNFDKIEKIGEGTFGQVLKGEYTNPETGEKKLMALKKLNMMHEKDGFPITALREIKYLKQLNHPNIVRLDDIICSKPNRKNKSRGSFYLVFEYLKHDLQGLIDKRVHFDVTHLKCLMLQIVQGVIYLHSQNVIHRDIKGANILIASNGIVKLADFGLARVFFPTAINPQYTNRVVTLWYRAPELLLGARTYNDTVDIWSLGCVFAEMFLQQVLFQGDKEERQVELIYKKCGSVSEENWPGVTQLKGFKEFGPKMKTHRVLKEFLIKQSDGKISEQLADLIDKMLTMDPSQRPTAIQVLSHGFFAASPEPCLPSQLPLPEEDQHEFIVKSEKKQRVNFRKKFLFQKPAYDVNDPQSKDFWKPEFEFYTKKCIIQAAPIPQEEQKNSHRPYQQYAKQSNFKGDQPNRHPQNAPGAQDAAASKLSSRKDGLGQQNTERGAPYYKSGNSKPGQQGTKPYGSNQEKRKESKDKRRRSRSYSHYSSSSNSSSSGSSSGSYSSSSSSPSSRSKKKSKSSANDASWKNPDANSQDSPSKKQKSTNLQETNEHRHRHQHQQLQDTQDQEDSAKVNQQQDQNQLSSELKALPCIEEQKGQQQVTAEQLSFNLGSAVVQTRQELKEKLRALSSAQEPEPVKISTSIGEITTITHKRKPYEEYMLAKSRALSGLSDEKQPLAPSVFSKAAQEQVRDCPPKPETMKDADGLQEKSMRNESTSLSRQERKEPPRDYGKGNHPSEQSYSREDGSKGYYNQQQRDVKYKDYDKYEDQQYQSHSRGYGGDYDKRRGRDSRERYPQSRYGNRDIYHHHHQSSHYGSSGGGYKSRDDPDRYQKGSNPPSYSSRQQPPSQYHYSSRERNPDYDYSKRPDDKSSYQYDRRGSPQSRPYQPHPPSSSSSAMQTYSRGAEKGDPDLEALRYDSEQYDDRKYSHSTSYKYHSYQQALPHDSYQSSGNSRPDYQHQQQSYGSRKPPYQQQYEPSYRSSYQGDKQQQQRYNQQKDYDQPMSHDYHKPNYPPPPPSSSAAQQSYNPSSDKRRTYNDESIKEGYYASSSSRNDQGSEGYSQRRTYQNYRDQQQQNQSSSSYDYKKRDYEASGGGGQYSRNYGGGSGRTGQDGSYERRQIRRSRSRHHDYQSSSSFGGLGSKRTPPRNQDERQPPSRKDTYEEGEVPK